MPYIIADLQGAATFGGYLKVDGGPSIALSDDLMIYVAPGTHYLEFTSQNSAERGMSKLNAAVGNYRTAAWMEKDAVDGKITETFYENTAMLFTVVSDNACNIVDLPTYEMQDLAPDRMANLDSMYNERISSQEAHEKKTAGLEFVLWLILGALGVHKFYRGKIGMGILYLLTGGLFGIGWLIDTIVLLVKWLKSRN